MVLCRFLGRSCVELKGPTDHIIIDPNYIEKPLKGIQKIFLTHEHEDHVNIEKIEEIAKNFSDEKENLKIFGPKSVKDKFELELTEVKDKSKINLDNFTIEVFKTSCYKSKGCVAYLLTKGDIKLLHTADSSTFLNELKEFEQNIDYCFIACFEDQFTNYLNFLKIIFPTITFPYHFAPGEEEKAKKLSDFLNEKGINSKFIEIGTEFEY